jgi:hypothetical protein
MDTAEASIEVGRSVAAADSVTAALPTTASDDLISSEE